MNNKRAIFLTLAALPVVLGASSSGADRPQATAGIDQGGQVRRYDQEVVEREKAAWALDVAQTDDSKTDTSEPADSAAGTDATSTPAETTSDATAATDGSTESAPVEAAPAGSTSPAPAEAAATTAAEPATVTPAPARHGFFYRLFHRKAAQQEQAPAEAAAQPGESGQAPAPAGEQGSDASSAPAVSGEMPASPGTANTGSADSAEQPAAAPVAPDQGAPSQPASAMGEAPVANTDANAETPSDTSAAGSAPAQAMTGAATSGSGEAETTATQEAPHGFWQKLRHLLPGGRHVEAPPPQEDQVQEDQNGFLSSDQTEHAVSLLGSALTLEDYLQLVAAKDDKIAYQRLEYRIAKSDSSGARSLFEPALTASYKYTDSDTPNTTEEQFRLSFAPEFIEKNHDWELGVEKKVPTGGKVKVAYSWMHLDNNIQPTPIRGKEDKAYVGLSLTQPLLKGAGGSSVVKSPIEVADKDQAIAEQTYRQSMFQTVSDAAMAYWDLYLADKKVEMRQKSVGIAQSVLDDEQQRNKFGQGSDTDVMSAQSAVAQRKVQLYEAQQEQVQARNKMRSFLVGIPDQYQIQIATSGELSSNAPVPEKTQALQEAYQNRPEYLASRLRAEKEDVKIKFARNNRLPQLDLIASYGLNGLDKSYGRSWQNAIDQNHQTAYVGIEYKMYLRGDRKARADLTQAQLRKQQALLEIRAAEMSIQNSIDTSLNNLKTALMQVHELDSIIATNNKLLDVEMARFKSGHSNSRDLLQLEQRLDETMETYLESKTNLQKAVIGVDLSRGTLLKDYDLED